MVECCACCSRLLRMQQPLQTNNNGHLATYRDNYSLHLLQVLTAPMAHDSHATGGTSSRSCHTCGIHQYAKLGCEQHQKVDQRSGIPLTPNQADQMPTRVKRRLGHECSGDIQDSHTTIVSDMAADLKQSFNPPCTPLRTGKCTQHELLCT